MQDLKNLTKKGNPVVKSSNAMTLKHLTAWLLQTEILLSSDN